jgi:membrane-associated phospholipid phosphatase
MSRALTLLIALTPVFQSNNATAADAITQAGDVLQHVIPAAALGATLIYEEGYDGTLQLAESYATTLVATEAMKRAVRRRRPNGACCNAFPSGHTSKAFAGAGFVHFRYGWRYALPAYAGAAFVAYSRVESDKHHASDVIAGAAVGLASSYFFTQPYEGVRILATAGVDGDVGVELASRW